MIDDVTKLGLELVSLMDSYFLGEDTFKASVSKVNREALEKVFIELLEMYSTDKNSSALREYITLKVAGFTATGGKLGFNGYKGNLKAEVKPINVSSEQVETDSNGNPEVYKVSRDGNKKGDSKLLHRGKLNGGGNFSDFTQNRLDKHTDSEETVMMLISGFVDGKLAYVLEFPFAHPDFMCLITDAVERHDGPKGLLRKRGQFNRSIEFNYKAYKSCPTLRAVWINKKLISRSTVLFNAEFLQFLNGLEWEVTIDEA